MLIDHENNVSLIAIFNELRRPPVDDIPANAQAPMKWDILAVWYREPSDAERTFEQHCVLLAPDGTAVMETKTEFKMPSPMHRQVMTVFGFPIAQIGAYSLSLRLDGSEIAAYPMFVGIDEGKQ